MPLHITAGGYVSPFITNDADPAENPTISVSYEVSNLITEFFTYGFLIRDDLSQEDPVDTAGPAFFNAFNVLPYVIGSPGAPPAPQPNVPDWGTRYAAL